MELLLHIKDDIYPAANLYKKRKSVRGIILDDLNRVAILKIDFTDMFGLRDHFELPGGGVESGEDLETALRREINEEVGVTIRDIIPLGKIIYEYNLLNRQEEGYFYIASVDSVGERHLTEEEKVWISDLRWIDIDELINMLESYNVENVGKIIHKRDLFILKIAKETLGNYKKE